MAIYSLIKSLQAEPTMAAAEQQSANAYKGAYDAIERAVAERKAQAKGAPISGATVEERRTSEVDRRLLDVGPPIGESDRRSGAERRTHGPATPFGRRNGPV